MQGGATTGTFSGALTDIGGGVSDSYFNDYRNPVIQEWNTTLQQEFKGWVFEAGYLGSKGQHLIDGESGGATLNQLPASAFALGTKLEDQLPNPFYGIITTPGSSLAQKTVTRRQLLTAFPQYTSVNAYRKPGANSNYESFTLSPNKRFSKRLQPQITSTAGQLLDTASPPLSSP